MVGSGCMDFQADICIPPSSRTSHPSTRHCVVISGKVPRHLQDNRFGPLECMFRPLKTHRSSGIVPPLIRQLRSMGVTHHPAYQLPRQALRPRQPHCRHPGQPDAPCPLLQEGRCPWRGSAAGRTGCPACWDLPGWTCRWPGDLPLAFTRFQRLP